MTQTKFRKFRLKKDMKNRKAIQTKFKFSTSTRLKTHHFQRAVKSIFCETKFCLSSEEE